MAANAFYVSQYLSGVSNGPTREALRALLNVSARRLSSVCLASAGLAIKTASSAVVKSVNTIYATVNGTLVTKAAGDMAALSGTVTNAKFNVFMFFVDAAGALTSGMGVEGATLALVGWPPLPVGGTVIGFIVVNPTGTGNFVGGTTALDDATVVPNAAYVNVQGAFDPNFQVSP